MRRVLMTALAAAATITLASPASASVVLNFHNGPDLSTAIHASGSNPQNDNVVVYGSTTWPVGQDVTFTANTPVHITGGSGFASIGDVVSDTDTTLFTQLVMDPVPNFTAYQFSVSLLGDAWVKIEYQLAGSGTWLTALTGTTTDPFFQNANTNKDYELDGTAGEVFSAVRLTTCSTSACTAAGAGFDLVKQNSITLAAAVPEPATWGMMLLGFAGIGMAMRRRRRSNGALMQIA